MSERAQRRFWVHAENDRGASERERCRGAQPSDFIRSRLLLGAPRPLEICKGGERKPFLAAATNLLLFASNFVPSPFYNIAYFLNIDRRQDQAGTQALRGAQERDRPDPRTLPQAVPERGERRRAADPETDPGLMRRGGLRSLRRGPKAVTASEKNVFKMPSS